MEQVSVSGLLALLSQQASAPYSPHQHEMAERNWRTMHGMTTYQPIYRRRCRHLQWDCCNNSQQVLQHTCGTDTTREKPHNVNIGFFVGFRICPYHRFKTKSEVNDNHMRAESLVPEVETLDQSWKETKVKQKQETSHIPPEWGKSDIIPSSDCCCRTTIQEATALG